MGDYKGGYTNFEFDVSRHEESARPLAALWGRRPESPNVKKRYTRCTSFCRDVESCKICAPAPARNGKKVDG